MLLHNLVDDSENVSDMCVRMPKVVDVCLAIVVKGRAGQDLSSLSVAYSLLAHLAMRSPQHAINQAVLRSKREFRSSSLKLWRLKCSFS